MVCAFYSNILSNENSRIKIQRDGSLAGIEVDRIRQDSAFVVNINYVWGKDKKEAKKPVTRKNRFFLKSNLENYLQ